MILKKIKPLFNGIVTTCELYNDSNATFEGSSLIDSTKIQKGIKEYQKVIAVGDSARGIKVGDIVCINPARYAKRTYEDNSIKGDLHKTNPVVSYYFNQIELDNNTCLLLFDSDINYVVEEYEEFEPNPDIVIPKKQLIY